MKLAVCVPPPICDCYGHLSRYAERVADVGAQRGVAVDILRHTDPDFASRLFANLADEDCIVHFHSFLYDLNLNAAVPGRRAVHVLEGARARTLATISDHPFTDFMQDMVRNAHPSTRFIVIDGTFADEMRFINPALTEARFDHVPFVPPVNFNEHVVVPFEERTYDLVMPIFIADVKPGAFNELIAKIAGTPLARTALATYEQALADLTQNPFHTFAACMAQEMHMSLADIGAMKPAVVSGFLNLLSNIDGIVRCERRQKVIGALLREVGDLRIAVMGDALPGFKVEGNVEYFGRCQADEAARLMGHSRAVLNCNPSYPTNVHERVSVGMLYESCVITDVNPCIAQSFGADHYIAYEPGSERSVVDLFDSNDVRGIAATAAATARAMPGFTWDGHFDEIIRVAQA